MRGAKKWDKEKAKKEKFLRWPGIEPGSTAWKAAMLTTIPPTLVEVCWAKFNYFILLTQSPGVFPKKPYFADVFDVFLAWIG